MLFNSGTFFLFLLVFFCFWNILKHKPTSRWLTLTIFSGFFYGWWDWRFLFLIIFSGFVDYLTGLLIKQKPHHAKYFLTISLVTNILCLSIFKYSRFFASSFEQALASIGFQVDLVAALPTFTLILPVGISFYTFQSMSYSIDVYRGKIEPTRNILHFFSFLMMFPQLVAGPIVRASEILERLAQTPVTTEESCWRGTKLVIAGYFRKVVIADGVAPFVNKAFSSTIIDQGASFWWLVAIAFSIQIYFDFSGYSRIARGIATWMGYDLPVNFNYPYTSSSLSEFWSRWHISLSTWFRDYLYIPLGGSRASSLRTSFNLWVTMLVSGLWHGAAWTFIVWAAIHSLLLSLEKLTNWPSLVGKVPLIGRLVATGITLFQVLIAWIFFRANSFDQAIKILEEMFSFQGGINFVFTSHLQLLFVIAAVWEGFHYFKLSQRVRIGKLEILFYALIVLATIIFRGPGGEFIYFQF